MSERGFKMTNELILEKVQKIFAEELDIDREEVQPDRRLVSDIGLSSMELLSLIAEIEKVFSLRISEKQLRTFVTTQDIVDCITANRKGKG